MKTTSSFISNLSSSLPLLSVLLLSGCVTAKMPAGSDAATLVTHPGKPKIAVASFRDIRSSEKSGSVSLSTLKVTKADLETVVTGQVLECLNRQLDMNVEKVQACERWDAKQLAASLEVKALVLGTIRKLEVYSPDVVTTPARAVLTGEVALYDAKGRELFRSELTANYTDYLGFRCLPEGTGRLVEAAARTFAHEMGKRLYEEGILKTLK